MKRQQTPKLSFVLIFFFFLEMSCNLSIWEEEKG